MRFDERVGHMNKIGGLSFLRVLHKMGYRQSKISSNFNYTLQIILVLLNLQRELSKCQMDWENELFSKDDVFGSIGPLVGGHM